MLMEHAYYVACRRKSNAKLNFEEVGYALLAILVAWGRVNLLLSFISLSRKFLVGLGIKVGLERSRDIN